MSEIAIRVDGLGKQYKIGRVRRRNDTLRDAIVKRFERSNGERENEELIWALRDVSFEVKRGEVVGVIGRNGAGKSTLLKILSRITEPTEGTVDIYGRVGSLLEVGTGFHPELTGRENIFLNGAILGMRRAEIVKKFDEIVAFAEVEKFIDTPVKRYSSGMYVRLAFAVAAHLEPEILVVDEVLAVGDAAFQKKCLGKMSDVAHEGRTVLFVSHNMSAILNLCSNVFVLERGQVTAKGTPSEAVAAYLRDSQQVQTHELELYQDRRGKGEVRIARAWLEDEQGGVIQQAVSGHTVQIVMQFRSNSTLLLQNCRASIAFEDLIGQMLFVCSTEISSSNSITMNVGNILKCRIPRFPLTQGDYRMTLFLEVNHEIQDWLQSAVPLGVVDGDFFGSGRQYPHGWQGKGVLVPHNWEISISDKPN